MSPSRGYPSIVRQLATVTTLVSGAVLALAGIILGAYDRSTAREALLRHLSIQTQIVASHSGSALLFQDPDAAEETLAALRAAPTIIAAQVSDLTGTPIARFTRPGATPQPWGLQLRNGQAEVHRFGDEQVVLTRRVMYRDKDVGFVSIAADYGELDARRAQYITAAAAVLIVSITASLFIALRLQRSISEPIVALAATAKKVTSERDYSVRAPVTGTASELVVLTDAFNDMLREIEQRNRSLKEAHDELEHRVALRTAELDHANKELEAFSYSVSHDLRAPLRHVTGFAGLLQEHSHEALDARGRKYLKTITTAAQRMGQLIDDLLAFSRMGRETLVRRAVNLNDLVRDTRHEVMALDGNDRRHVEWTVGDLPVVSADASMLRLVLTNLLSNALKYSMPRDPARIEIGATTTPDEATVFIRDNGVGFDMQYANKLFGVFQRLHSSDVFEGTGIGLANVKRIIHRHGGRVWAEGEPDRGATFYFSLPLV